jgi:hypothetical protein
MKFGARMEQSISHQQCNPTSTTKELKIKRHSQTKMERDEIVPWRPWRRGRREADGSYITEAERKGVEGCTS